MGLRLRHSIVRQRLPVQVIVRSKCHLVAISIMAAYIRSNHGRNMTVNKVLCLSKDSLQNRESAERADERPEVNNVLGRFVWRR